jgi:hypothetical protein
MECDRQTPPDVSLFQKTKNFKEAEPNPGSLVSAEVSTGTGGLLSDPNQQVKVKSLENH